MIKKLLYYIPFILLIGCAAPKIHKTGTIYAPSADYLKSKIYNADTATQAATLSNERLRGNIDKTSNYASRIDAKTEVIIRNWSKARQKKNLE